MLCADAVHDAETMYRLPPGLLLAIGRVESGRSDPVTKRTDPWPWTVQAGDKGMYFSTKAQAVEWTRDALARGVSSIDIGCMQVNLHFHPAAFQTLEEGFDPRLNVAYALRFLLQLHAASGDWWQAVGAYHSQTQALASAYTGRVENALNGSGSAVPWSSPPQPPGLLRQLATAWQATLMPQPPPSPTPYGGWGMPVRRQSEALASRRCSAGCSYQVAGTFRKIGP